MAVVLDAHAVNSPSSTTSPETLTFTCSGSNRALAVFVYTYGGALATGATYNGVTMTQLAQVRATASGNSERTLTVYGLTAPATGANTLSVSLSAQAQTRGIVVMSFNGVDQGTSFGTVNTATVNATTASTTVSAATGDKVVSAVHARTTTAPSATGSGQVILDTVTATGPNALGADAQQAGATSVTSSWSWGATPDNGAAFSVPVKWDGTTTQANPAARNPLTVRAAAVRRASVI